MPHPVNRFPKASRLYLRREIDLLMSGGKQIRNYPVNVIYCKITGENGGLKIAVSVPKRLIKNAVQRNRIKRRMREAFRLNCHEARDFFSERKIMVHMMFIYGSKELSEYALIESKIILILQRLVKDHDLGVV